MDLSAAEQIALDYLARTGLTEKGWRFAFDRTTSRLGVCHYRTKVIALSRVMVAAATADDVEQVVQHETAHALVGPGHKHDAVWRAKAQSLGYRGRAKAENPAQSENLRRMAERVGGIFVPDVGRMLTRGERVRLRDGRTGTVVRWGGARYRVTIDGLGRDMMCPPSLLILLDAAAAASASVLHDQTRPVAAPIALARPGQIVQVSAKAGPKWGGRRYVVAKTNPSRYKVDLGGGRSLTIPHSLATLVDAEAA